MQISFESLYNNLLLNGNIIEKVGDYELIYPKKEIKILSKGIKYVPIKAISRHKTTKDILEITSRTEENGIENIVKTTTDHVCMICTPDKFFENTSAKYLKIGDYLLVYDEETNKEYLSPIISIKNLGKTEDYVYDIEVNDDSHVFFANNVYVHNSQFLTIACLTDKMINEKGYNKKLKDWTDNQKLELWDNVEDIVNNEINPYVQKLITDTCYTSQASALKYSLEYIGDTGVYEQKKHYSVHKILSEGPEIVDKIKYSGIELKKASIPKQIKVYLQEIYEGVLTKDWNESDFKKYLTDVYEKFKTFSVEDIALWKGYNTARQSTGFLTMEKGATGISKAVSYYNDMLKALKINKKYDQLLVGDNCRFTYILPDNQYGINCIAFKDGNYPKEFNDIFRPDYDTMFDKVVISSLKRFLEAVKFDKIDPRNQMLVDIFDL